MTDPETPASEQAFETIASFPFLRLPPELRDAVYAMALVDTDAYPGESGLELVADYLILADVSIPWLASVSKQIRKECAHVFVSLFPLQVYLTPISRLVEGHQLFMRPEVVTWLKEAQCWTKKLNKPLGIVFMVQKTAEEEVAANMHQHESQCYMMHNLCVSWNKAGGSLRLAHVLPHCPMCSASIPFSYITSLGLIYWGRNFPADIEDFPRQLVELHAANLGLFNALCKPLWRRKGVTLADIEVIASKLDLKTAKRIGNDGNALCMTARYTTTTLDRFKELCTAAGIEHEGTSIRVSRLPDGHIVTDIMTADPDNRVTPEQGAAFNELLRPGMTPSPHGTVSVFDAHGNVGLWDI